MEQNINEKQNSEQNITDIIKYFYGAEKHNQCRNRVLVLSDVKNHKKYTKSVRVNRSVLTNYPTQRKTERSC